MLIQAARRQHLTGHSYQDFAQTVATPERKNELAEFLKLARARDWERLSKFQEFEGDKNSA